ncbi:Glutathione S-transferase family protein [Raphanus sativus]|nr:Glutathione S-transferase family protein [Raphanus sativus]
MRRVTGLAARTISSSVAVLPRLGHTTAMMTTIPSSEPPSPRFGGLPTPTFAGGVAGIVFFSAAAASSLGQEVHAKDMSHKFNPKEVVLYQYEACPFCNKVKAFLDFNKIPYKIVEVNPFDSSVIIDSLFQRMHPEISKSEDDEEMKWRKWVDNHLVHILSPNIYRSTSEALESFDYITTHGNFGFTERLVAKYAGATAMYFVSKKLKKKYNITDERAALYDAAETWVDALNGRPFLGGSRPNLADLAVFGVLRPIRYLRSGKDMVDNTRIGEWYSRMENTVGEPSGIKE